uniref:MADF domain-containing protein n=1 Tax=Anopheles epiroticus TaxID=199890 RepID=A0A182P1D2_9DIPT
MPVAIADLKPLINVLRRQLVACVRNQGNMNMHEEYDSEIEILVEYDPDPTINTTTSDTASSKRKAPSKELSCSISKEQTLEFIALVKSIPLLWDKTHIDYKNFKMMEKSWRSIASSMGVEVDVCKDKWISLRAQFRKIMRKIIDSRQPEAGMAKTYQSCWFAYDAMSFLNGSDGLDGEGKTDTSALSREKHLELITTVQSLPVLWNKAYRNIKRVRKLDAAWQLVASRVGLSVALCKEKWSVLRAHYYRIRKKNVKARLDKSRTESIPQPSWYAYEAMKFLDETFDQTYFLSNKVTIEFIEVVESYPLLWDKSHPYYKHGTKMEETWQLVADEMDLDVEDCREKWNSLRSQFLRIRKQILKAEGSNKPYQPRWFAYDAMKFLTNIVHSGKVKKRRLIAPFLSSRRTSGSCMVRETEDGFFLDSLDILDESENYLDNETDQYPTFDDLSNEEYLSDDSNDLEELEQQSKSNEDDLMEQIESCDDDRDSPQQIEAVEPSNSAASPVSQEYNIESFIKKLTQRLHQKEKSFLEEIGHELLKVVDRYPDGEHAKKMMAIRSDIQTSEESDELS